MRGAAESAVVPDRGGITAFRSSASHRPPRLLCGVVRRLRDRAGEAGLGRRRIAKARRVTSQLAGRTHHHVRARWLWRGTLVRHRRLWFLVALLTLLVAAWFVLDRLGDVDGI